MSKRRNIYRGVNKRRNNASKILVTGTIVVCVLGGVTLVKKLDFNMMDKIKQIEQISLFKPKDNNIEEFTYNDVSDLNENKNSDTDKKDTSSKNNITNKKDNEVAKLSTITNWDMYSIQIAALDNEEELKKVEQKLSAKKIPFSIVEIDGIKKVQTYVTINEDETRKYLDNIKVDFPDAFVSKVNVPLLTLEYTNKHSYVADISENLNNLITNFEEESSFWVKNNDKLNIEEYKNIHNKRSEIIKNLDKQAKKINYEGMNAFKENLLEYTKSVKTKSEESLKMVETDKSYISQSLFMSCMQGYYSFINSIKTA